MIYYTGDLHIGTRDLIYLECRPFNGNNEQNAVLTQNFSKLTEKDELYILGDVMFSTGYQNLKVLRAIKARKHLIIGNHDEGVLASLKAAKVFDTIRERAMITDNGRLVFLSHYPHAEWPRMYRGAYHLFAHIHDTDNAAQRFMTSLPNAFNVGCMLHDYHAVTLDELITRPKDTYNYIEQGERNLRAARVRVSNKATRELTAMSADLAYENVLRTIERDTSMDAKSRQAVLKVLRSNKDKAMESLKLDLRKLITPESDIFCVDEERE